MLVFTLEAFKLLEDSFSLFGLIENWVHMGGLSFGCHLLGLYW